MLEEKSINLTSIYLFLNNFFHGNQTVDSPLLYVDNNYLDGSPEINYLNIDVEGIEKKINRIYRVMEIKNFSDHFKDIKVAHGINFEDERGSLKENPVR